MCANVSIKITKKSAFKPRKLPPGRQEAEIREQQLQSQLEESRTLAQRRLQEEVALWAAREAALQASLAEALAEKDRLTTSAAEEAARLSSLLWTERDKASRLQSRLDAAREDASKAVNSPSKLCPEMSCPALSVTSLRTSSAPFTSAFVAHGALPCVFKAPLVTF